jgi:tol-pal system protein YbgF
VKGTRGFLTLAFLALVVSSCVTTQNIEDLQHQVNSLKDDMDVLKKTSLDTRATSGANYDSVMEEFKKLRGTYEQKQYEFDQKAEEIAVLKEVVNRTTADIESRLFAIEQRLSAIENKLGVKPPPPTGAPAGTKPEETVSGTVEGAGTPPETGTADDLYAQSYKKYQDKDYAGAVDGFRAFIDRSPDSSLADNAYFWIGESYYGQGDYERAILEYDTLIKKYPSADKVPSAMLKEAYAFLELGDEPSAKTLLNELVKKYPKEPQAEAAKKKLEVLK